jgi:hypothetical protein
MAKKKKLQDDVWMWMSLPFTPGLAQVSRLPQPIMEKVLDDVGREYHTFLKAFGMYARTGFLGSPGGALTPTITAAAARYGAGPALALGAGLALEYLVMAVLVTTLGTILDPMDYYEGGLMTPEQATKFRAGIAETKGVLFSQDESMGALEREARRFLSPPGSARRKSGLIPPGF